MTEKDLQRVEWLLDTADAKATANIVFAAILRLGAVGRDAGLALQDCIAGVDAAEMRGTWDEGVSLLLDADQGGIAL